jgi:competence protein ComEA
MNEQDKVNVNTASREELKQIENVGDSLADHIIKYREQNDGLQSEQDLEEVWRISGEQFDRVRDRVTL